ncbi:hypothetical protein FB451DRAFT_1485065 [Mycena latifolia]|nr:hypothetical protein FB451DRAFT_1485065 [Mycena latifolia]
MQCFYPPSPHLIHPLQKYFHQLLDLFQQYPRTQQGAGRVKHIALNVKNMSELLLRGLNQDTPDLADTIDYTLSMKLFIQNTNLGYYHLIPMLMEQMEAVLPGNCDEKVKAQLMTWKFQSRSPTLSTDAELLITQAISHFHQLNDPALECRFYIQVGLYYYYAESKSSLALKYLHKALDLAKLCGDRRQEALVLNHLGQIKWLIGDYGAGQKHAQGPPHFSLVTKAVVTLKIASSSVKERESYWSFVARNIHKQFARDAAAQEPYYYAWALLNIAQLDIILGASKKDVLSNLEKAMVLFDAHRYGYYDAMTAKIYCNIVLGQLHLREGEILTAKGILQTCFESTWGNDTQGALSCMECFANIHNWPEHDFNWAASWTVFLRDVFQAEGNHATSTSLFTVALEGFTRMDIHFSRAECMLRLGDLGKGHGDVLKAIELWKTARPLFERSSQGKQVIQIDERLAAITNNVLEEPTDSLTHLGQLNAPITGVPKEETHASEGGAHGKDKELVPMLI